MSKKNPEYDFKWCPGCGDFGVRRALELAMIDRMEETGQPMENTVVVAGIGCSGNLVHLLEGAQPYGIHGIHGRSLPIALGVKMARPALNVVVVAGDGDFLSIGGEHIAPQAARNLNIHVQSPCTTYNDTFIELKGDLKNGIQPTLWDVPEEHDQSDRAAAYSLLQQGGVPVGVIYHDSDRPSFDQSLETTWEKAQPKKIEQLMGAFEF